MADSKNLFLHANTDEEKAAMAAFGLKDGDGITEDELKKRLKKRQAASHPDRCQDPAEKAKKAEEYKRYAQYYDILIKQHKAPQMSVEDQMSPEDKARLGKVLAGIPPEGIRNVATPLTPEDKAHLARMLAELKPHDPQFQEEKRRAHKERMRTHEEYIQAADERIAATIVRTDESRARTLQVAAETAQLKKETAEAKVELAKLKAERERLEREREEKEEKEAQKAKKSAAKKRRQEERAKAQREASTLPMAEADSISNSKVSQKATGKTRQASSPQASQHHARVLSAKEEAASNTFSNTYYSYLPDKLFIFQLRLWQWMRKSSEGKDFIKYLSQWQQAYVQEHPQQALLDLSSNEGLLKVLHSYISVYNQRFGDSYWFGWFYRLIHKMSTAKELEHALVLWFTLDQALEQEVYTVINPTEASASLTANQPAKRYDAIHTATKHIALSLQGVESKLWNFQPRFEQGETMEVENSGVLHEQMKKLYDDSGWFSALRRAIRTIWSDIQRCYNPRMATVPHAAQTKHSAKPQTVHTTTKSAPKIEAASEPEVCAAASSESTLTSSDDETIKDFINNDVLVTIAEETQPLIPDSFLSTLVNAKTQLEALIHEFPENNNLQSKGIGEIQESWDRDIQQALRDHQQWGWLSGKPASEKTLKNREYYYIRQLLASIHNFIDVTPTDNILCHPTSFELKSQGLLKLLVEGTLLPKPYKNKRAISLRTSPREEVSQKLWQTMVTLKHGLFNAIADDDINRYPILSPFYEGLNAFLRSHQTTQLPAWREKHKTELTKLYQVFCQHYQSRYEQWKQEHASDIEKAEGIIRPIRVAFYHAMCALSEGEAMSYRIWIQATLKKLDTIFSGEDHSFSADSSSSTASSSLFNTNWRRAHEAYIRQMNQDIQTLAQTWLAIRQDLEPTQEAELAAQWRELNEKAGQVKAAQTNEVSISLRETVRESISAFEAALSEASKQLTPTATR